MVNMYKHLSKIWTQATVFKKVESSIFDNDAINIFRQNVAELNTGLCIIIWFTVYVLSMQAMIK